MLYLTFVVVMVTVTAKFHNPSLSRQKEWQRGTRLDRDTKQLCINGWRNGDLEKSVTTTSIDNGLYSAIQNQAIREATSAHSRDGDFCYRERQSFVVNNQSWEIDTTSTVDYTSVKIFDPRGVDVAHGRRAGSMTSFGAVRSAVSRGLL